MQQKLEAVRGRYVTDATRIRTNYLFSGLLVCKRCNRPLTIVGGSHSRYYRCTTSRSDSKCENVRHIKQGLARTRILDAIKQRLASPQGKDYVRERIASYAKDHSIEVNARIAECRDRIAKTEAQIKEMVDYIKKGEHSQFLGSSLREQESYLRAEKATLAKLLDESAKPARLPSADEVARLTYDFDKRLARDIEVGRAQLVRWLRTGSLRVSQESDGAVHAKGALNLRAILADAENSKPAKGLAGSNFRPVYRRSSGGRI
ncbi:MAG TPA: recombinase zinc beta ribbon domain-containing protein [Kofleriaceae bacterium]|nr:recombinase zinc beta ribbon domain-containing protein [Kofleriaceae bacterium]